MIPARGLVLLRAIVTEETQGGGKIIIPQEAREKLVSSQMEVVAVGAEDACEDPDECGHDKSDHSMDINATHLFLTHPIDPRIKPGAWVLVKHRSLVDAGEGQYLCKQTDVLGIFLVSDLGGQLKPTGAMNSPYDVDDSWYFDLASEPDCWYWDRSLEGDWRILNPDKSPLTAWHPTPRAALVEAESTRHNSLA